MFGVVGADEAAIDLALELCLWSRQVILFTNEPADGGPAPKLPPGSCVRLVVGVIGGLHSAHGVENQLHAVSLENGERIACEVLFFSPHQAQHSSLAQRMGCQVDGSIVGSDTEGGTGVPGLFVVGNVSAGVQMAVVAAAEGLVTGAAINTWLMGNDA